MNHALRAVLVAMTVAALLACSPEAVRSRNSGPGADVGNHSPNSPEPSTAPTIVVRT